MSTSALLLTSVVAMLSNLRDSARSNARSPLLSSSFSLAGSYNVDSVHLPVYSMAHKGNDGGRHAFHLRVHLNQVEEDDIFPLNFNGFVKRILCFRFDHLVQKLRAHGAEILFPQVVLLQEHETIIKVANQWRKGRPSSCRKKPQNPENGW